MNRTWRIWLCFACLSPLWLCLPGASAGAHAGTRPMRIVSNNMCTDQLLLALADRARIAALSPFAGNRALSFAAEKAVGIPRVSGTSEDVLMIRPDLVLTSQFDRRTTVAFIRSKGTRVEAFELVQTVEGVKEQILRMGHLLGAEAEARAMVEKIDASVSKLKDAVQDQRQHQQGLRVLPLARRGWSAGKDTLIGDILKLAGLVNVSDQPGMPYGAFLSLETVISLRPDAIMLSASGEEAEDNGTAMLLHPALERHFPQERRIVLPDRLTVCGGPMIIEAMDLLAAEIRKVTLRPR
jgi:iron complex transport system substrate-binding protein